MSAVNAFIKRHSVLTYYALAFAISWGGVLIVLGPGGILGTTAQSEVLMPFLYVAMLLGPSVAGILMTGLVSGRVGFRGLQSQLFRWRVGAVWYVVALLTAPILFTAVSLVLSLTSRDFLPRILISDDRAPLLLSGVVAGIMVGIFEELGWTGFVTPRLRLRYGVLVTGLIMGLLWGAWHFPLFSGGAASSESVPPALYLAVLLFSWLPPYRVLIVWVYGRTGSLLMAMLMHVPTVVAQSVLIQPAMSEVQGVTYDVVLAAALWVVVAAVAVASRGQFRQAAVLASDTQGRQPGRRVA